RGFRAFCETRPRLDAMLQSGPGTVLRVALTFVCVCVGWVFFRATTFTTAAIILERMVIPHAGSGTPLNGISFWCLLGVLGLGHGVPERRDVAYAQKVTRLRQRTEEAPTQPLTVVMLGSSRTVFGLKAGRLEKPLQEETGRPVVVFNFGMYASGPVMNLVTLR